MYSFRCGVQRSGILLVAAAITGVVCGCGGSTEPASVESIILSQAQIAFPNGVISPSVTVTATPRSGGGTVLPTRVTFSTSDASVASVQAVGDQAATVTAVGAGSATVTVTAGGKVATATVSVTPIVRSLSVTPNPVAQLLPGDFNELTVSLQADPKVPNDVSWTVSNPALATITATGPSTARLVAVSAGSGTVTVSSVADPGKSASTPFTILDILGLAVSPTSLALDVAATSQLTATTTPSAAPVAWRTSNPTIAQVSATGLVTAVAVGDAIITAEATAKPSVNATVPVHVNGRVLSVTCAPGSVELWAGNTTQLAPGISVDPGVSTALTFESSSAAVAAVSEGGLVTALKKGSATITVRSVANPARTGSCQVTVSRDVATISVIPASPVIIGVPGQQQMTATVTADPGVNSAVTWTSSDPTVATVNSSSGLVTSVKDGQTTITATSVASPGVSGSTLLTVAIVRGITLVPPVDSIRVGWLRFLSATVTADPGVSTAATYASLNPGVASIDQFSGLATGLAIGTTTIKASAVADATKVAQATLVVGSPCTVPLTTLPVGSAISGVVNAGSCSSGLSAREHEWIRYAVGDNPAVAITTTSNFIHGAAPLVTAGGSYWYLTGGAVGTSTRFQVFASPGLYRSYIANTAPGAYGNVSWSTESPAANTAICNQPTVATTNISTGVIPITTSCPSAAPPSGPAGTYYGLTLYLLPPLEAGQTINITATSTGFQPRLVLTNATQFSQLEAKATVNTTVTLSYTAATRAYFHVRATSLLPGQTGTISVSLTGPAAAAMAPWAASGGFPQDGMRIPLPP